jgi:hypothetical protein
MTLQSGLEIPTEKIAGICRRYGIQEMAVFGSAARNDMRPDSDLDIMVEFFSETKYGPSKTNSLPCSAAASTSAQRNASSPGCETTSCANLVSYMRPDRRQAHRHLDRGRADRKVR